MSNSFQKNLEQYADLAVRVGVGLQKGQRLLVRSPVEAAELTRLTILQQAGTAILAQANQQPQLALQLLG